MAALSLTGTGLLLAVTNELCQNVAVVPLLWIVPLTAYLLTFIICFSGMYRRSIWMWVLIGSLAFLSWLVRQNVTQPFAIQVGRCSACSSPAAWCATASWSTSGRRRGT